jgi:hypothetical protein
MPVALFLLDAEIVQVYDLKIAVGLTGLLICLAYWRPASLSFPVSVLISGYILLPLAAVYGTANGYFYQFLYIGAAFWLLPAWITLATSEGSSVKPARNIVSAGAVLIVAISTYVVVLAPYRIAGNLQSELLPSTMPGGDVLHLTRPVWNFVEGLQPHAYRSETTAQAPVVFDLSGQLPIAVHILNGHTPGVAWLLGSLGFEYIQETYGRLEDATVLNGWVLAELNDDNSIQKDTVHFIALDTRIQAAGTSFEAHYALVAILTAPYFGEQNRTITVGLFKPETR